MTFTLHIIEIALLCGIAALQIRTLKKGEAQTMTTVLEALGDLQKEVERSTTVTDSAVALIKGFAAKFDAVKTDPIAVEQLVAQMRHNADVLAEAVKANTEAAPAALPPLGEPPPPSTAPPSTPSPTA